MMKKIGIITILFSILLYSKPVITSDKKICLMVAAYRKKSKDRSATMRRAQQEYGRSRNLRVVPDDLYGFDGYYDFKVV